MTSKMNRRAFIGAAAATPFVPYFFSDAVRAADEKSPKIAGFDLTDTEYDPLQEWRPYTDRKLRVGLVGYGVCQFSAEFYFQNHPNVEVVAVSDLFPDRCNALAERVKCSKTYPSLEEMVKDDSIEAIFVATDAPSHADHVVKALKAGKHVASAVPAVWGSVEDGFRLYEAVKESGLFYGMFETSAYHDDVYAARKIYKAGGFGQMIYTEGEYYHYGCGTLEGYRNWRRGLPPQWYPTHSNAYYTCVTGNSFTKVSCVGHKSKLEEYQSGANPYDNPFGTEVALFTTSEGGSARMAVSWDSAGWGGETGRMRGEVGAMNGGYAPMGDDVAKKVADLGDLRKPALPPGVVPGYHGGSHGYLGSNFVESVLKGRHPLVNVAIALNTTLAGVVAHQSALRDGETLDIPQFSMWDA